MKYRAKQHRIIVLYIIININYYKAMNKTICIVKYLAGIRKKYSQERRFLMKSEAEILKYIGYHVNFLQYINDT